jgi:hypothetical protein
VNQISYLQLLLVDVLLVRSVVGSRAGGRRVIHLLSRRALRRRRLSTFDGLGHDDGLDVESELRLMLVERPHRRDQGYSSSAYALQVRFSKVPGAELRRGMVNRQQTVGDQGTLNVLGTQELLQMRVLLTEGRSDITLGDYTSG